MVKFVLKVSRNKMEKIKNFFSRIFEHNLRKKRDDNKYDHVVTIDDTDGRTEVTRTCSTKKDRKIVLRFSFVVNFVFCLIITLLWVTAFWFLVKFSSIPHAEKPNFLDYFYFSYFIVIVIVSITCIHFEASFLRSFEFYAPKIAIVVRKSQARRQFIVRMRVIGGEKDFIETEIDDTKLTLNDILEMVSKELNLEKENIVSLYKIPETRIRSDADIKRFRRLEYIEVHTRS